MQSIIMNRIRNTKFEKETFAKWAEWANNNGYVIVPMPNNTEKVYSQKIGEKNYFVRQDDGSVIKFPYNPTGDAVPEDTTETVEFVDGKTYIKGEEPQKTEEMMRNIRDSYLVKYVDPIVTNPLRWEELSEKEKTDLKNYRNYLLNIPQDKEFPDVDILNFDSFLKYEEFCKDVD